MKTKIEIINETVKFYKADPDRRAINESTRLCVYITPDNKKCALGRCMIEPTRFAQVSAGVCHGLFKEALGTDKLDDVLKPEHRGHAKTFWENLQLLHDQNEYWESDGLSCDGQEHVEWLHKKYASK